MWKKEISKVLIIDDSVNSVLEISNILKGEKYSISSSCGARGFELAMKEKPDIILLDLLLENSNGFEILRNLRDNVWTKNIPVIIVTKLNTQLYWEEAYRTGAKGYIVKGIHYSSLAKKVRDSISEYESEIFRKIAVPSYKTRKKDKVLHS
jgi:twitching motility two-component system response regulator PilH